MVGSEIFFPSILLLRLNLKYFPVYQLIIKNMLCCESDDKDPAASMQVLLEGVSGLIPCFLNS